MLALAVVTIVAFVRALRAGHVGWAIAIGVGVLFGISWFVAIVYLLTSQRMRTRT